MRVATRDDSLSKTPTLLEFLKIMHDACVAQRNLHRRGILHRDINDRNIMMAPKDNGQYYEGCVDRYDDVKYVNQVLDPKQSPKPACLVIDLGHSADIHHLSKVSAANKKSINIAERKGTPKFISRSVSKCELLYILHWVKMPKLDGRPHKLYTSCTESMYEAYNKAVDEGSQSSSEPAATRFTHQLFHDAESTFWVISWFLARSAPNDYEKENKLNPKLTRFIKGMEAHYPSNETIDPRADFSATLEAWKQILHPRLVDVAPMLSEMHEYILPEWGYRPELNTEYPEHAHEALMRLLLREIVRIEDDKTKDVVFAPLGTRNLLG
ncbi:kinase domain protein [Rhizoctonia solani 123E]|uniref:Kinase domain protein n=1 Tax=Rhizoctonia solani 123E TaxID=1423351 RepID=A0A074RHK4_9AGAM|nr:kinase domain protein [Rhizoctonia solani 123E]